MEANSSVHCSNRTQAEDGNGDSTKKERSKNVVARTSVITRSAKKERTKDANVSPRVSRSIETCAKNRTGDKSYEEGTIIRDDFLLETEKNTSTVQHFEHSSELQPERSNHDEGKHCSNDEEKRGRKVGKKQVPSQGQKQGESDEMKEEDNEGDEVEREDTSTLRPDNKLQPDCSAGQILNAPLSPDARHAIAGNNVSMVGILSKRSPINPPKGTKTTTAVSTTEDVVYLSSSASRADRSQDGDGTSMVVPTDTNCLDRKMASAPTDVCYQDGKTDSASTDICGQDRKMDPAPTDVCCRDWKMGSIPTDVSFVDRKMNPAPTDVCCQTTVMDSANGSNQTKDKSVEKANNTETADSRECMNKVREITDKAKEAEDEMRRRMTLNRIILESKELVSESEYCFPRTAACASHTSPCGHVENLPAWVQQPRECSGMKAGQRDVALIHQTQAADRVDTGNNANMVGDAQGEDSNLFYVLDDEDRCKVPEASGAEVTGPSVDPSGAAGEGEAANDVERASEQQQACGGGDDSGSVHTSQAVKREPAETMDKSVRAKTERSFEIDPSLIPIKAIPALNAVPPPPPQQHQPKPLDTVETIPYIPPDTSMMYQPEEGVLKSRPVPRPTRGRRGRRRGSVGLTSAFRHCSPGLHPEDLRALREPRRVHQHPYQRYGLPGHAAALPLQYCNVEVPGGEFDVIRPDAAGDMMGVYGDLSGLPGIPPRYPPNSRWYCSEDYLKAPSPWYSEYEVVYTLQFTSNMKISEKCPILSPCRLMCSVLKTLECHSLDATNKTLGANKLLLILYPPFFLTRDVCVCVCVWGGGAGGGDSILAPIYL